MVVWFLKTIFKDFQFQQIRRICGSWDDDQNVKSQKKTEWAKKKQNKNQQILYYSNDHTRLVHRNDDNLNIDDTVKPV